MLNINNEGPVTQVLIFEGVDRIGKSTTLKHAKEHFESKGMRTLYLHDKDSIEPVFTKSGFESLQSIEDIWEKAIFNLESYVYFIRLLAKHYDVILIDRLHLTPKAYADVNRKGSIERVFGSEKEFNNYFSLIEDALVRSDELSVNLYVFTKEDGSTYEDDDANDRWQQSVESQVKVNEQFVELFYTSKLPKIHFKCVETSPNYFNTLKQFNNYLTQTDKWQNLLSKL